VNVSNSVVAPIENGWKELNGLVDSLGPHGLSITGPDGWAVKDHLVHIAAWEHSLLALLDGSDRRTAMGVPETDEETDTLNAAVWALHRNKTPEQAVAYFREAHAALMDLLGKMSDTDLQLSYNHYQPNDPRAENDDRPVVDWVAGNTYDHYAEHIEWISQLVKDSSAAR
jgi:hypothetical protein